MLAESGDRIEALAWCYMMSSVCIYRRIGLDRRCFTGGIYCATCIRATDISKRFAFFVDFLHA